MVMMSARIKILITGGHLTPALAVMSEMQSRGYKDFIWVGHKYNQWGSRSTSPEFQIVHELGLQFIDLKAGKLTRNWGEGGWRAGIVNLIKIPFGFLHSAWIIMRHQPDVVISFGGYLALPIAIIAKLMGKLVITHEQTAVTGLTNRIIPRFADKVLISWQSSAQYYPPAKTIFTGNPLRPEIFAVKSHNFNFTNDLPTIYITGGNQGSHKLNVAIFDCLADLLPVCNVIHQTGNSTATGDNLRSKEILSKLSPELKEHYWPADFVPSAHIGEAFALSSLVIARSGANTTSEILALAKPAILVPIPWVTHNEQQLNAEIAAQTGIATILPEAELTAESLYREINSWLKALAQQKTPTGKDLRAAQVDARNQIDPYAAQKIVQVIESLIEEHKK